MDYRELLLKYVEHVGRMTERTYIDCVESNFGTLFLEADVAELRRIDVEAQRRYHPDLDPDEENVS